MHNIACLHTADSNVAVFDEAAGTLGLVLRHHVRADLLADAERAGGLDAALAARTRAVLRELAADGDAVLLTCSTLGPCADPPVLRVDAALAHAAVAGGGSVVVLCAVATTMAPTEALFRQAAAETGATIEIRLVPGAWDAFKSGKPLRYAALIAEAAEAALAAGADRVALAQASMAGSLRLLARDGRVLASPLIGLQATLALTHQGAPR